jgi:AcrR family transcriptional regulator
MYRNNMKTNTELPVAKSPTPRGRKRDHQVRATILTILIQQIRELGYSNVTIDGLAKAAKVGRMTIYRWWSTKAEIALEAAEFVAESAAPIVVDKHISLESALQDLLTKTFTALQDTGTLYAALMSEAQSNPEFAALFYERFVLQRRQGLENLFLQAQQKGEMGNQIRLNLLVDLVYGAMWYRLLMRHAPLDASFAEELTQAVIQAAGSLVQN